ncbi:MAG: hypothetical protein H7X85_00675 [Thermoanaerobaculia bacterium]|nr:hypothetical protein [Thermoanaerobaculia bacterium]
MSDEREVQGSAATPAGERGLADELRALGQSFSALGRTAFREGRVLSVEALRSVRGVVDRAREEIDKLTAEKR